MNMFSSLSSYFFSSSPAGVSSPALPPSPPVEEENIIQQPLNTETFREEPEFLPEEEPIPLTPAVSFPHVAADEEIQITPQSISVLPQLEALEPRNLTFEKLMKEFKVPLFLMQKQNLDKEDIKSALYNSYVTSCPTPSEIEACAEHYSSQLDQLQEFMREFKNQPIDLKNFSPQALMYMLTTNIWKGKQKAALQQALKDKVLQEPETIKRFSFEQFPNLFLFSDNYRLLFDNVDYENFTKRKN